MLTLFEAIADEHTVELGVDGMTLRKRENAFWIISRMKLKINEIVKDHDNISVKTWPAKSEGLRCGRSYQITNTDTGIVAVNAFADWVLLDTETRKFRTAESVHFPELQFITEKALDEPFRRFKNIFTEDDFVYERIVRPCEIDVSHHTNNVKYSAMLLDSFSIKELEEMNIKELEIYYIAESHEGETLRIYRKAVDNGWQFMIKRDGNTITMGFIGI